MRMTFFNGAMPVFFLFEDNGYKPRLTISSGNNEIVAELTDEDQEELGNYLLGTTVKDLEMEIDVLNKEISKLEGERDDAEEERESVENELESRDDEIKELRAEIKRLTKELNEKG